MLQLFRTNQPLTVILLIVYAFILRLSTLIFPVEWQPQNANIFSDVLYDWVGTSGFLSSLFGVILVIVQGLMLNAAVNNHKMAKQLTFMPAAMYILLASCLPDFLHLHPVHFSNTFLILAIMSLYGSYKQYVAAGTLFNVGFFIAIGSLFYFSANVFLLLGFVGLSIIRSLNLNDIIIILLGFIVPYFLLGTYLYWYDRIDELQYIIGQFSFFNFELTANWFTYIQLGLISLLILWSVFGANAFFAKTSIQVQKNISVLFWTLLIGSFSLFYQSKVDFGHLLIIIVPLSVFLAFHLLNLKNKTIADVIHLFIFAAALLFQYKDGLIKIITN